MTTGDGGRGWRTADVPLPVLVLGLIVFAGAAIGAAALGGRLGVALAAVVVAAGVLVVLEWSRAPYDDSPPAEQ